MRRAAPPLPISPKLLKHFAAITLVLTASIAMFADGESREVITDQVDMRAARNQLLETEAEKLGTKKLKAHLTLKDNGRAYLPFAEEGQANEFGAGMDGGGGGTVPECAVACCHIFTPRTPAFPTPEKNCAHKTTSAT